MDVTICRQCWVSRLHQKFSIALTKAIKGQQNWRERRGSRIIHSQGLHDGVNVMIQYLQQKIHGRVDQNSCNRSIRFGQNGQ